MIAGLQTVARGVLFILAAFLACAVVFQIAGYSAWTVLTSIADGAFLGPNAAWRSLRWALPLFVTALGVGVAFRAGYFNIGAQGQFYVGAIAAAFMADWLNGLPPVIVIPANYGFADDVSL